MAKTKKAKGDQPSKTDAIIAQVQQNPTTGNGEIADALNAMYGWSISSGYVSTIKSQKGLTKKRRTRKNKTPATTVRRVGRPKAATKLEYSLAELQDAKQFAEHVGGIDRARRALDALAELQANADG